MSDIGICQTCGCPVREAEGYSYKDGSVVMHHNDHLCLLALLEENRKLKVEIARHEIHEEKQQVPSMQILGGLQVMVSPFWKTGFVLVSSDDWNRAMKGEIEKTTDLIKGILDIEPRKKL